MYSGYIMSTFVGGVNGIVGIFECIVGIFECIVGISSVH